jgi:ribosomal protein S18 acetylase RimI-like enzyme/SAM-dependent methyltransferase
MKKFTKVIAIILSISLLFQQTGFAQVAGILDLSGFIAGLHKSITVDKFRPLHLRYLAYDNINNNFKLLLDKGDIKNLQNSQVEDTSKQLLNLFFVGVTLPNDSFWVNLRPDAPDKMIDSLVAQTDVGRVFCEADLQLKKDTAKFTSPDTVEGKEYWSKLYQKAGEIFGTENVTIPTLTRPWIVPDEIIIRESTDNAYIYKATLKVMLEQDYLKGSATYNFNDERLKALNEYSSQLIRELIIPKLTKEINTSKRYAPLRQVYYSLIMAQWFKQKFYGKGGLYSWLIDKQKLDGLTSKESWSKDYYFKEYKKSFEQGEYNFKEAVYTPYGQTIRSYFSGGIAFGQGTEGIANAISKGVVQTSSPLVSPDGTLLGLASNNQAISDSVDVAGGNTDNPAGIKVSVLSSKVSSPAAPTSAEPLKSPGADIRNAKNAINPDMTIAILVRQIHDVYNSALNRSGQLDDDTVRSLEQLIEDNKVEIALKDGKVAGYIIHDVLKNGAGYLQLLMVARDAQDEGIGSALMDRAIGRLRDKGVVKVKVEPEYGSGAFHNQYFHSRYPSSSSIDFAKVGFAYVDITSPAASSPVPEVGASPVKFSQEKKATYVPNNFTVYERDFTDATKAGRLLVVQERLVPVLRQMQKRKKEGQPLIIVDPAIGGRGAPTVSDLITLLHKEGFSNVQIYGFDFQPSCIAQAQNRFQHIALPPGFKVKFLKADIFHLKEDTGLSNVDMIIAANVFMHYFDKQEELMRSCREVLSDRGELVVVDGPGVDENDRIVSGATYTRHGKFKDNIETWDIFTEEMIEKVAALSAPAASSPAKDASSPVQLVLSEASEEVRNDDLDVPMNAIGWSDESQAGRLYTYGMGNCVSIVLAGIDQAGKRKGILAHIPDEVFLLDKAKEEKFLALFKQKIGDLGIRLENSKIIVLYYEPFGPAAASQAAISLTKNLANTQGISVQALEKREVLFDVREGVAYPAYGDNRPTDGSAPHVNIGYVSSPVIPQSASDLQDKIVEARRLNASQGWSTGIEVGGVRTALTEQVKHRHVVIGDIHGELEGLKQILRDAGLIDIQDNWIGGDTVLVQMGDMIDRGPMGIQATEFLRRLQEQGVKVVRLMGNHELMFIQGVLGDDLMLAEWIRNGGWSVVKELGILDAAGIRDGEIDQNLLSAAPAMVSGEASFKRRLDANSGRMRDRLAKMGVNTDDAYLMAQQRKIVALLDAVKDNPDLMDFFFLIMQDIRDDKLIAAYAQGGFLFVHGGAVPEISLDRDAVTLAADINQRFKKALDLAQGVSFEDDIFNDDDTDLYQGIFWARSAFDLRAAEDTGEDLVPQIVAHEPENVYGSRVRKSPKGTIINVDVGVAENYKGNRGYAVLEGQELKGYELVRQKASPASSPINPYAAAQNEVLDRATQESRNRIAALNSIGPGLEKDIEKILGRQGVKIAIVPVGSSLRGYSGKDSDIECEILILKGGGGELTKGDVRLIGRKLNAQLASSGYKSGKRYELDVAPVSVFDVEAALSVKPAGISDASFMIPLLFLPMAYGDPKEVEKARKSAVSFLLSQDLISWGDVQNTYEDKIALSLDRIDEKPHLDAWLRSQGQDPADIDAVRKWWSRLTALPSFEEMLKIYPGKPRELAEPVEAVTQFNSGDVVRHPVFGEGTVTGFDKLDDGEPLIIIKFVREGRYVLNEISGQLTVVRPAASSPVPAQPDSGGITQPDVENWLAAFAAKISGKNRSADETALAFAIRILPQYSNTTLRILASLDTLSARSQQGASSAESVFYAIDNLETVLANAQEEPSNPTVQSRSDIDRIIQSVVTVANNLKQEGLDLERKRFGNIIKPSANASSPVAPTPSGGLQRAIIEVLAENQAALQEDPHQDRRELAKEAATHLKGILQNLPLSSESIPTAQTNAMFDLLQLAGAEDTIKLLEWHLRMTGIRRNPDSNTEREMIAALRKMVLRNHIETSIVVEGKPVAVELLSIAGNNTLTYRIQGYPGVVVKAFFTTEGAETYNDNARELEAIMRQLASKVIPVRIAGFTLYRIPHIAATLFINGEEGMPGVVVQQEGQEEVPATDVKLLKAALLQEGLVLVDDKSSNFRKGFKNADGSIDNNPSVVDTGALQRVSSSPVQIPLALRERIVRLEREVSLHSAGGEIMPVDMARLRLDDKSIPEAVSRGVALRLDFSGFAADYRKIRDAILDLSIILDEASKADFINDQVRRTAEEMIKNALVHGNGLSLGLPVFVLLEVENGYLEVYDVHNDLAETAPERERAMAASKAILHGGGQGIERIAKMLPGGETLNLMPAGASGGYVARVQFKTKASSPVFILDVFREGQEISLSGRNLFINQVFKQGRRAVGVDRVTGQKFFLRHVINESGVPSPGGEHPYIATLKQISAMGFTNVDKFVFASPYLQGWVIATEYTEGRELGEYLKEIESQPEAFEDNLLHFIGELSRISQTELAIHNRFLQAHGDISNENIIVSAGDNSFKLSDFEMLSMGSTASFEDTPQLGRLLWLALYNFRKNPALYSAQRWEKLKINSLVSISEQAFLRKISLIDFINALTDYLAILQPPAASSPTAQLSDIAIAIQQLNGKTVVHQEVKCLFRAATDTYSGQHYDGHIILETEDGRPIGYWDINTRSKQDIELGYLYVEPEFRGRHFSEFIIQEVTAVFPAGRSIVSEILESGSLQAFMFGQPFTSTQAYKMFKGAGWELSDLYYLCSLDDKKYSGGSIREAMMSDEKGGDSGGALILAGSLMATFERVASSPVLTGQDLVFKWYRKPMDVNRAPVFQRKTLPVLTEKEQSDLEPYLEAWGYDSADFFGYENGDYANAIIAYVRENGVLVPAGIQAYDAVARHNRAHSLGVHVEERYRVPGLQLGSRLRKQLLDYLTTRYTTMVIPVEPNTGAQGFNNYWLGLLGDAVVAKEPDKTNVGWNRSVTIDLGKVDLGFIAKQINSARAEDAPVASDRVALLNPALAVSSPVEQAVSPRDEKGGIDLRALPIAIQPMPNQLPAPMVPNLSLQNDQDWLEIQNMLSSGITPSGERLKDYAGKCSGQRDFNKILSCLADILRLEEDRVVYTDPALRQLLVVLESGKNTQELQSELGKISFAPQEPEPVE